MSTPRRSAVALVTLAVRLLPHGSVRARYRQELLAELHELDRTRQLRCAAGVLAHAPLLRRAVLRSETAPAASMRPPTVPLHCRLHLWHHYRQASTEDGQRYRRCAECGRDQTGDIEPEGRSLSARGLPMP